MADVSRNGRAALAYAERFGWHVSPIYEIGTDGRCTCGRPNCQNPGKHPRTEHGLKDATTNLKTILDWWKKWPGANIAVGTGEVAGFDVLDIDPRHGGNKTLADLVAGHGPLPDTVTTLTGGEGQHLYFRHHLGLKSRNGLLSGIDLKADGGYVLVPPSNHVTGRIYVWGAKPGKVELEPWPAWLLELVQPTNGNPPPPAMAESSPPASGRENERYAQTALADEVGTVEQACPGQQNDILNRASFNLGQLVAAGELDEADTFERLVDAGCRMVNEPNREPWTREKVEAQVRHGLEDGKQHPRSIPPTSLTASLTANSPSANWGSKVASMPDEQFAAPLGGGSQQTTQYTRQTLADLRASYTPTEWLVDGVLPRPGMLLIAGIPGIGKTWLVLDTALSVAMGRTWLNRFQTRQGAVLLVLEEEDASAILERLDALYSGLGLSQEEGDGLPVHLLVQQGVSLVQPDGTLDAELLRHIQEVQPSLLVLDPFRRVHGLDENDSGVMSFLFKRLRWLTNEYTCSLLLVHHLRKRSDGPEDALDRLRGSSDIAASVDSVLEVGGEFGNLVLKHSKSKRGPCLGTFLVHNDIEKGGIRMKFLDPDVKADLDRKAIRQFVTDALQAGEMNQSQLYGASQKKKRGYGKERLKKACEELIQEGILAQRDGERKSKILVLTEQFADAPAPPSANCSKGEIHERF